MIRNLLILLIILGIVSCANVDNANNYGSYFDNLENLDVTGDRLSGHSKKLIVGSQSQINNDTVRSGQNSLKLGGKNIYGLNYTLPRVRTDEHIEASVWYRGPGPLVLVASHDDPKYFYRKNGSIISDDKGWNKLTLELSIPPSMDMEDLKIYAWNPNGNPVYLDDFNLTYHRFKSYPEYKGVEGIHLIVDTLDMLKLERKRNAAFNHGILVSEDDDYVSGIMYYNDSIMPVEIRLKGDWLDHLEGRKWSFRVKMKKQTTWKHMRAFSLQTPESRDFLSEYVSHQLLRDNDLLTTRYGFVPVTINGTSLGVYAWEEHFDKQLVESLDRREGPILKFDESSFWSSYTVTSKKSHVFNLPFFEGSKILPFKLNRTLKTPTLADNFLLGQNLLNQYRWRQKNVSDIFDYDKLAAYYALMDLTRGFHGLTWHNQRYYYNPVICKLEPIFFDAYTKDGAYDEGRKQLVGFIDDDPASRKRYDELFWIKNFEDQLFQRSYISYLEKFSDHQWISSFLGDYMPDIDRYESWISEEFLGYQYNRGYLLDNARNIRAVLSDYKTMYENNPYYATVKIDSSRLREITKSYDKGLPELYLNAYLKDSITNGYTVHFANFNPFEVEVLGYGENENILDGSLGESLKINPYRYLEAPVGEATFPIKNGFVFFRIVGQEDRLSVPIMPFPPPENYTPEQDLFIGAEIPDLPFVKSEGEMITFISGSHTVDSPVVIPPHYVAVFEPGCEIDFVNGGFLVSKSPVIVRGESDRPVRIYSSDNTSNGFTVLQSPSGCELDYVIFEGLNTLAYKGWGLTGAVNFYESDVEIKNVEFRSNVCEDALNIIRSEFKVSDSKFIDTYADAFDSDFCSGLVEGVTFDKIGNDAIDFSGSQVVIRECTINNAGDKGVSAGENSQLEVFNTIVTGANIAYASKDQSVLLLDRCTANSINYGVLAFQKKPEYGPGHIRAKGFRADGVVTPYLIEKFSTLILNGTIVQGEATKVAELFY